MPKFKNQITYALILAFDSILYIFFKYLDTLWASQFEFKVLW